MKLPSKVAPVSLYLQDAYRSVADYRRWGKDPANKEPHRRDFGVAAAQAASGMS